MSLHPIHSFLRLLSRLVRAPNARKRLIDRSREHKGFETKKKKKKKKFDRTALRQLFGIHTIPWAGYERDAKIEQNRKAERKRVPQRELRISWEKCEGKVSWMAFATIHSFYLLFRRSNSPLSAKPIGFPSILLHRSKRHRPFFFSAVINHPDFQFANIGPFDYCFLAGILRDKSKKY